TTSTTVRQKFGSRRPGPAISSCPRTESIRPARLPGVLPGAAELGVAKRLADQGCEVVDRVVGRDRRGCLGSEVVELEPPRKLDAGPRDALPKGDAYLPYQTVRVDPHVDRKLVGAERRLEH